MTVLDDDVPTEAEPHQPHIDGALMLAFGPVHVGREALAVETFQDVTKYLGRVLAEGRISSFKPFFFAEGGQPNTVGFFLVEGRQGALDALREDWEFVKLVLKAGAGTSHVRVQTLIAGSNAGRLVNTYAAVRRELGLID